MSSFAVDTQQNWVGLELIVLDGVMKSGSEFQRMQWTDAIIMVGGRDQRGRILGIAAFRRANVMYWWQLHQILEMILLVGVSIVGDPCMSDGKFMETKQVHNTHLSNCRAK